MSLVSLFKKALSMPLTPRRVSVSRRCVSRRLEHHVVLGRLLIIVSLVLSVLSVRIRMTCSSALLSL